MELNSELDRLQEKYNTLLQKVAEMRNAQRNYFRYRGTDFLAMAKKFEKEVDNLLSENTAQPVVKPEHPKLF